MAFALSSPGLLDRASSGTEAFKAAVTSESAQDIAHKILFVVATFIANTSAVRLAPIAFGASLLIGVANPNAVNNILTAAKKSDSFVKIAFGITCFFAVPQLMLIKPATLYVAGACFVGAHTIAKITKMT